MGSSAGAGEIMEIEDIMAFLKIGKSLAYRMCREDEIPHFKLGGRVVTSRRALEAWAYKKALGSIGIEVDITPVQVDEQKLDFDTLIRRAAMKAIR